VHQKQEHEKGRKTCKLFAFSSARPINWPVVIVVAATQGLSPANAFCHLGNLLPGAF